MATKTTRVNGIDIQTYKFQKHNAGTLARRIAARMERGDSSVQKIDVTSPRIVEIWFAVDSEFNTWSKPDWFEVGKILFCDSGRVCVIGKVNF